MSVSKKTDINEKFSTALRYWLGRLVPETQLTPGRIALGYALFGVFALFVSDVLFVEYLSEPLLRQIQALKGGVEVVVTGGLIYVLANRRETQLRRTRSHVANQREQLQVLHRVLRHNLRNDLNVVAGHASMIQRESTDQCFEEECLTIRETAEKMLHYTERASQIRRIADSDEQTKFDLTEVIPRIVEDRRESGETSISTTVPDRAVVEADPMFGAALDELLTNAIEHCDSSKPGIGIEVDPESGPQHVVEIRVVDDGPGIPPTELEVLREGMEDQMLHLSGMGLWFVQWTVRQSGGSLAFETDDGGTTAVVRVPKAPEMLLASLG